MTCAADPIATLVADMLTIRRYLAELPGTRSSLGPALDGLAAGILGDGNSARYPRMDVREMRPMPKQPDACERFEALRSSAGHAVRHWLLVAPISEDARPHPLRLSGSGVRVGAGDRKAAAREQPLTLAQACAWALVDDATRAKWARAIVRGDARPALSAMTVRGEALLEAAAKEWDR